MILYLIHLYNTSKTWLLERKDVMFQVKKNMPEGELHNKYWVEDEGWGSTLIVKIRKYFDK